MDNNKISNPKTEVPKGTELNDKDYLNACLSLLKEMEKNYTVALTEASNENLFNKYDTVFNEIKSLQRDTFELAFRKGWYSLEKAEANKINQKLTMLNQEFDGLSE